MIKTIVLLLLLYAPSVFSNDEILSLRTIYHARDKGFIFISSGRIDNHSKNSTQIESLWRSKNITFTDKNWRGFKTVEVKELNFNEGADAQHYLIFHDKKIVARNVKGAYLYQSGCAGEIVPVLNLGKWPFEKTRASYLGAAIEIDRKYGIPSISNAKQEDFFHLLSAGEKQINTESFQPLELKWNKIENKKVILIEHDPGHGDYTPKLIIINTKTNKHKFFESKTVLDGRC